MGTEMNGDLGVRRWVAGVVVVGLLASVPLAAAAEITRDEYVARVEPVCKRNVEANSRIFKGAKAEVEAGELGKGSRHFSKAASALRRTIAQLKRVPRPSADEVKLGKWIGYLETEADYFARIGQALAAGKKSQAQNLSVRLNRNSNLANNTVISFDFDYCKIDSTRFV
jgi:hypothetical protein